MKSRIWIAWAVFVIGASGFLPAALAVYALLWALTESALRWMQVPAGSLLGKFPKNKTTLRKIAWTVLAGVGISGLIQLTQIALSYVVPGFVEWQLKTEQEIGGLDLLIALLIGPWVEELALRGALLRGLTHWRGPRVALLWCAGVSAFLYADPIATPLFAVILGILVIETQSLWSAVVARLFLSVFYLAMLQVFPPSTTLDLLRENVWKAAFFLALGTPGIWMMLSCWRKLPKAKRRTA